MRERLYLLKRIIGRLAIDDEVFDVWVSLIPDAYQCVFDSGGRIIGGGDYGNGWKWQGSV